MGESASLTRPVSPRQARVAQPGLPGAPSPTSEGQRFQSIVVVLCSHGGGVTVVLAAVPSPAEEEVA